MELVASLPADWPAAGPPVAAASAPWLRSAAAERFADGADAPFDSLLALLDTPPAGGETLPVAGNALPLVPIVPFAPPPATLPPLVGQPGSAAPASLSTAEPASAGIATTMPSAEVGGSTEPGSAWRATWPAQIAAAVPSLATAVSIAPAPLTSAGAPPQAPLPSVSPPAEVRPAAPTALLSEHSAAPTGTTLERVLANLAPHVAPSAASPRSAPLPPRAIADTAPPDVRAAAHAQAAPFAATGPLPSVEMAAAVAEPVARRGKALSLAMLSVTSPMAVDSAAPAAPLQPATAGTSAAPSLVAASAPASAHGAPLDTRTPTWQDAFASRVQWLVDHRVGEARIKLNPPELGAVDVKISLVDDQTFVQLTAATAAARDELAQGLPRLRELFAASGIELGGASVHGGGDGRAGQGGAAGHDDSGRVPLRGDLAAFGDGGPPATPRRAAAGRIDTFA